MQVHKTARPKMMRSALKAPGVDFESRAGLDSNSLWIIEREKAAFGGPCKWDDSFRLLHLNSGRFLSIVEGARSGKTSVVCRDQNRANATLFRLKKLKNETTGGVKGMPHVISPNQPFLVCADLDSEQERKIPASGTTRIEGTGEVVATNPTKPDAEEKISDSDSDSESGQDLAEDSRRRWLSSEDEAPFTDRNISALVGQPIHEVSFAINAIRTERIQDAMEFQNVERREINDAVRGLVISRQLDFLATTMKADHDQKPNSYKPAKSQLFAILASAEKVILFALKTNLSAHIREGQTKGSTSYNFEQSCQAIKHLSHYINFPDSAHQQVLCEQGVLEKLFGILDILTGILKRLKGLVHDKSNSRKQHKPTTKQWSKVRQSIFGVAFNNTVMKMAQQESNRQRTEDVRSLCQVMFLAVSAICSRNKKTEIYASKWMSFMLESLLTGLEDLGAENCLTRMLDHNDYLLHHVVSDQHVKLIVQLLRTKFILKPSYLSLLEALCSFSDGDAVPHQQNRIFNELIGNHSNLLLRLRLSPHLPADATASVFPDPGRSAIKLVNDPGTNSSDGKEEKVRESMYERARKNSMNLFKSSPHLTHLEKYRASEHREIEVTWRVDASELPKQIKKASPQRLFPSHAREDGDNWWVPLRKLMQPDHTASHVPGNEQLQEKIAEYFSFQLKLMCSLCIDRNCLVMSAIEKEFTYQLVLAGMADDLLPWTCRRRFADLMKSLWIDRPPFHPMVLPRRVRISRIEDEFSNSITTVLTLKEEKSEFADFGITNPQEITSDFVVLQVFLISYIRSIGEGRDGDKSSNGGVLSTRNEHRAQNMFTSFCISLLSSLTSYGFFSTVEQQKALIEPVLNLLDGRNDQVIADSVSRRLSERSISEVDQQSYDFGSDIADMLERAQEDSLKQAHSPDLQASSQFADSAREDQIIAVKLSAEKTVVSPNSARGLVTRIVKSKVYTVTILTAVPFSVVAGVIGVLFTNPRDTVSLVNPEWVIEDISVWKFLFYFDFFFVAVFIVDVLLRSFAMSWQYYLMDFICTLDLLVSILDIAGLLLTIYASGDLSAATGFISALRISRIFRVILRSFRCGRLYQSIQYMQEEDDPVEVITTEKVDLRYEDSVVTESINRIKVELLKLLRSLLSMHLDHVLGMYLSEIRTSTARSEVFFELFSTQNTSKKLVLHSKYSHSPSSKVRNNAVVPLSTLRTDMRNMGQRAQLHSAKTDSILCDLMMYDSKQISSAALQVLVMLHEQASQFMKELTNSQLLADRHSIKTFQSMTQDANILSFALESFEVWSSAADKAGVTSRRVLRTIERLNQQNSKDTSLVLRRGLRRLGLIETIVHEILFIDLAELNNNSWTNQNGATEVFLSVGGKEELRNVGNIIFAAVCTFLVSFVKNDRTNKNLIADIPACLDYFSRGLHNIKHTASCCDVLAALLHHNVGLCKSSWASQLIAKVADCLVGPITEWAEKDLCLPHLWNTVTKLFSLLIQLALCDSVSLNHNQTLMIRLLLDRIHATEGKMNWCIDLKWLQAQKQYLPHTPEAQAAFMQFLRLISICCVSATNNRTRDMCARLFSLSSLLESYTEHVLPRAVKFCICEVIRHFVFVNDSYDKVSSSIKEMELTANATIKWLESSTRLIQSFLGAKPVDEAESGASNFQFKSDDEMRLELFSSLNETSKQDHGMVFNADFMHIAFQVIPITEMILRVNVAPESRQRFQQSMRAFADEMSGLAMAVIAHDREGELLPLSTDTDKHRALLQSLELSETKDDHHFLEQFHIVSLGMFARQLSLCLLSLVSVAAKMAWSDVVPQALERYLYRTMEVSNSSKTAHAPRNQSPHTRCWGIYTSASKRNSCEYSAVQSDEKHGRRLRGATLSELCDDEAEVLMQDRAVKQFLNDEREGVVRAMDKDANELPTLLKRLIHIANLQLGQISQVNQSHTIATVTEVIKVVKQYLGEVDQEGSETVTNKQHLVVEAGTLELLVRLMSWNGLPRKLFLEIVDLGCSILAVAGGYRAAQKRVHQFLCDSTSQTFFVSMEAQFRLSSEKLLALHAEKRIQRKESFGIGTARTLTEDATSLRATDTSSFEATSYDSKTVVEEDDAGEDGDPQSVEGDDPGNRKLLRFWQWLCEGNYQPNQHLLRAQPHNPRSINLLTMAVNLLDEIAQRDLGEVENLLVVTGLNNILCEAVQGACAENQRWLALETELLDTSNNILRQLNVLSALFRTESRQEKKENSSRIEDLIEDLQQDVVQLLRALLERAVDRSIAEKMCAVIKCEPLLFRMALIRQKVQALERDDDMEGLLLDLDAEQKQEEISEARTLGADILNLILTLAQWAPDWFRRIEVSQTAYPALRADSQDLEESEPVITNRELLAWFQKDMAAVEIDWDGVNVLHWFFVQGYNLHMTQDEIIASVSANDGDTHVKKLIKFMKTAEILYVEIKPKKDICKKLCPKFQLTRAWQWGLQTTCFVICCVVNFIELVCLTNFRAADSADTKPDYDLTPYFIKNELLTANNLVVGMIIAKAIQIALYTVHISLLLVAKRDLICRDLGEQDVAPGFDVNQEANPVNRCCQRLHKTAFSEHNRVSDAVQRLAARTVFLLCTIISIEMPFTQAVILFDIITIWPRLNDTTQALASAIPKVLSSFVLLFVCVFVLAKFEFFYLESYFENGACTTMASCMWITLQLALTMDFQGTIKTHDPLRELSHWMLIDIAFTSIFVIVVNILLMNIIFGTIIDAFSKLREEKAAAEQQKLNVCYICSVTRQQFEKVSTSQGFDHHQQSRHNLADYVRFIYYIRTKNANDLTGAEHYVLDQLERYDSRWFPKKKRFLTGQLSDSESS